MSVILFGLCAVTVISLIVYLISVYDELKDKDRLISMVESRISLLETKLTRVERSLTNVKCASFIAKQE